MTKIILPKVKRVNLDQPGLEAIDRIRPLTKRGFLWHRFMMVLKHPFTFKKRRWPITYYEDGVEKDRLNITFH